MVQDLANIFEMELADLLSFDENQIFNNTFKDHSNGFFNVKKVVAETFDNEREIFKDQIISLKEEIMYLRKKLDEK